MASFSLILRERSRASCGGLESPVLRFPLPRALSLLESSATAPGAEGSSPRRRARSLDLESPLFRSLPLLRALSLLESSATAPGAEGSLARRRARSLDLASPIFRSLPLLRALSLLESSATAPGAEGSLARRRARSFAFESPSPRRSLLGLLSPLLRL